MEIQLTSPTQNLSKAQLVVNDKPNIQIKKNNAGYKLDYGDNLAVSNKNNCKQDQLREIKETIRKSKDGSALIKTFEDALSGTINIIRKMKSLAVESCNSEYTDDDRIIIETEYQKLCDNIDSIANVSYKDTSLLNGNGDTSEIEKSINTEISPEVKKAVDDMTLQSINTVNCGDLTISGSNMVEGIDYSYNNNTLTILSDKSMVLSGTSTVDHIVVKSGVNANLTLNNLDLQFNDGKAAFNSADWEIGTCAFKIEDNSTGNVHINLIGENTLKSGAYCAGLQKSGGVNTGTLTIEGNGILNAIGRGGAGIGGKAGDSKPKGIYSDSIGISATESSGCNIVINSGTINAYTDDRVINGLGYAFANGAAIGGGEGGDGRNITINGGTIRAISEIGAGIGGGNDNSNGYEGDTVGGNGTNIIINGGTIYAKGSCGIGSADGYETSVTITGGKIIAEGKTAIGIDLYCNERPQKEHKIVISGGEILAKSTSGWMTIGDKGWIHMYGAGIGTCGNEESTPPAIISISGKDTVVITYSENADNIGSGCVIDENNEIHTTPSTITISDGLVSEEFNGTTELGEIIGGTIVHFNPDSPNPTDPDNPNPDPAAPDKPNPNPDKPNNNPSNPTPTAKPPVDFGGIVLQMGSRSKDAVRFTFNYAPKGIGYLQNDLDCTSNGLGLNSLSLGTEENAIYALGEMDYALNKANAIMSRFSLAQNRFNNISASVQNPDIGSILYNNSNETTAKATENLNSNFQ